MSKIMLVDAKAFLDVIHDSDDAKLQMLLDAAEDEAAMFMNVNSLSDWSELPFSVLIGTLLLLQGNYQAPVDDIAKLRSAAETKLMPYRGGLGI